ncbi:DUF192 domain-containing protein [Halopenitus sp. H-Gu1]|uniref:DUF192 domain-containing protein n=1 Tax=Halopenitus sp. H-Gu1 TaxID=3242697 RepID=UPI00359F050C
MNRRLTVIGLLLVAAALGLLAVDLWPAEAGEYDRTTVEIEDGDTGERLATVEVRIADTQTKRYTGLSETESLDPDEGMLFIHDEPGSYAYVMRNMSFPIDIVFINADGTISTIHSAEADSDARYEGQGQYVLEVRYGYMADHGIETGDRVIIDR